MAPLRQASCKESHGTRMRVKSGPPLSDSDASEKPICIVSVNNKRGFKRLRVENTTPCLHTLDTVRGTGSCRRPVATSVINPFE